MPFEDQFLLFFFKLTHILTWDAQTFASVSVCMNHHRSRGNNCCLYPFSAVESVILILINCLALR